MFDEAHLGPNLRRLRHARGLTQREAARRLGWGADHLADLERGRNTPSLALLLALCEVLGCSPNDLLAAPAGVPR